MTSGSGPEDAAFYRSEPFLSLYRRSLEEGFNNGGAGYVRDTLIAMRTWDLDLDAITCPVQVLFGAGDLTHSPDHGETLTGRIPGATRKVFPEAGGALLWTHAREILEAVATWGFRSIIVPKQLGVNYNLDILEPFATHVALALGWQPNTAGAVTGNRQRPATGGDRQPTLRGLNRGHV